MHSSLSLTLMNYLGCWDITQHWQNKGQICAPQSAEHDNEVPTSFAGKMFFGEHPQVTEIMNLCPVSLPILLIDYFTD